MTQIVTPYLLYEDVGAAIDWLDKAFGFREELRYAEPDGRVSHAEVRLGEGAVMLGGPPTSPTATAPTGPRTPRDIGGPSTTR